MNVVRHLIIVIVVSSVVAFVTTKVFAPEVTLIEGDPEARTVVSRNVVREDSEIIQTVAESEGAVVSVIVTKDLRVVERSFDSGDFFGLFPRYRDLGTERREIGGGTAFFISEDGLLLTNRHVVSDEDAQYLILLNDGSTKEAEVVARDPSNDIALLQVEGNDFDVLEFSPEKLLLGQTVIAIGNALGEFRNTVSVGVVSGLKRSLIAGDGSGMTEQLDQIIQTDAAINSGNSGGPLLNVHGKVIGMNTAVAAGAQNIGFAIPSADLFAAVESYRKHGKILKAVLGVRYMYITQENEFGYDYGIVLLPGDNGESAVIPGSPADNAGLQERDIILAFDGEKISLERTLASIIRRRQPGDTITLLIVRDGEEREVEAVLVAQE